MAMEHVEHSSQGMVRPLDGLYLTFLVMFVIFLVLAVLGQMLFWNWRTWLPGAEGAQSMWDGSKSAVYTVISHLS